MATEEVIHNGKRLCIEINEVWDFVRDIHSFQVNIVDKAKMQRYKIGSYKTKEIAEQKAWEYIITN